MRTFASCLLVLVVIGSCLGAVAELPQRIDDREFWRLTIDLSESGGTFPQQLMSNEDSAQFVIPDLKERTPKGGVYLGVGSEQNFTYIAAIRPKLAFIVDIRRDNVVEHLMYKALFELSRDRADFVSRLFSRKRPAGLDASSTVTAIFDAFQSIEPDSATFEQNRTQVIDLLVGTHGFPVSDADRSAIAGMMTSFRNAGPFTLKGFGDTTNPPYAKLMAATDMQGRQQSFLASEENFRVVQELQRQNMIVAVTGDFAGDKTIKAIGRYLAERGTTVQTFYVSNVERYLFEQGDHGKQFYANAATLPRDPSSTFIRSVTSDISARLAIPIPDSPTKWRTFLFPMNDCLKAVADGRIQTYRDLFTLSAQ